MNILNVCLWGSLSSSTLLNTSNLFKMAMGGSGLLDNIHGAPKASLGKLDASERVTKI